MCGIFLFISQCNDDTGSKVLQDNTIQYFLSRRGPDEQGLQIVECGDIKLTFYSTVLQLRGRLGSKQPLRSLNGSILQFNGQIFGSPFLEGDKSDTEQLMDKVTKADDPLSILASIHGPWAFTYFDNNLKKLWFGRDIFGKRSLCWNTDMRDQMIVISSVAHIYDVSDSNTKFEPLFDLPKEYEELPTSGICCFDFGSHDTLAQVVSNVELYQWNRGVTGMPRPGITDSMYLASPLRVPFNQLVPDAQVDLSLKEVSSLEQSIIPDDIVAMFENQLSAAVMIRCGNQQNVCRQCMSRYVTGKVAPAGKHAHDIGLDHCHFYAGTEDELKSERNSVVNGISFPECQHASTAVLFSGGIDSSMLALLADRHVPANLPIELLNVAFDSEAPDRQTGLSGWNELCQLCPNRKWLYVSILVGKEELDQYLGKHIRHLISPLKTVLDESIGASIWFATRGKGELLQQQANHVGTLYKSRARVLLLGMGADEQLGGYSRHRNAFIRESWPGLIKEMCDYFEQISTRNMGRDDRVTSDHGVEGRFPFLDEDVVNFLNGLPVWHKCNLYLERGVGEKWLLRLLATRLGMTRTALNEKRAIQFGSKITKLSGEKGRKNVASRVSTRLTK